MADTPREDRWATVSPSSPASTVEDPELSEDEGKTWRRRSKNRAGFTNASSPPPQSSPAPADENQLDGPADTRGRRKSAKNRYLSALKDDTPSRGSSRSGTKRPRKAKGGKAALSWIQDGPRDTEDEGSIADNQSRSDVDFRSNSGAANAVGTRRQANGTIGSVYSGNKMRHLKKEDGAPLWRKDIQYEFLQLVFDDEKPVFTRFADGKKGFSFTDIYVDAMSRSSKTSKILKDKLQTDRLAAKNMAMICLLVNVGRMNTTLNFFPEMRAQLRTYHSIPVLQAQQDPNSYKQLQDAPRLKSILKGASEDEEQPKSLEAIQASPVPRSNPVNLIFVLSQCAPRVSELHFHPPRDFFDLVMRPSITSKSRARAFLWLMWWYLESNFTREDSMNNPFGPGTDATANRDGVPLKVPEFEHLTDEQAALENVDSPEEVAYGEQKQRERKRIIEEDDPTTDKTIKKLKKSANEELSDVESPPPVSQETLRIIPSKHSINYDASTGKFGENLDSEFEPVNPHPGRGRYKRVKKAEKEMAEFKANNPGLINSNVTPSQIRIPSKGMAATPDPTGLTPQPLPPHVNPLASTQHKQPTYENGTPAPQPVYVASTTSGRRPRPLTQHQLALESHRQERIRLILYHRKKAAFAEIRSLRTQTDFVTKAAYRIRKLPIGYDSEDEDNSQGMGGLGPLSDELEDYGEEAEMWLSVVRKARRRLFRWNGEEDENPEVGMWGKGGWGLPGELSGLRGSNGGGGGGDQQAMLPMHLMAQGQQLLREESGAPVAAATVTKKPRGGARRGGGRTKKDKIAAAAAAAAEAEAAASSSFMAEGNGEEVEMMMDGPAPEKRRSKKRTAGGPKRPYRRRDRDAAKVKAAMEVEIEEREESLLPGEGEGEPQSPTAAEVEGLDDIDKDLLAGEDSESDGDGAGAGDGDAKGGGGGLLHLQPAHAATGGEEEEDDYADPDSDSEEWGVGGPTWDQAVKDFEAGRAKSMRRIDMGEEESDVDVEMDDY